MHELFKYSGVMTVDAERKWITSALGWTCFLCTVAVLPAAAFDPINLPKLTVLTICALAILGLIFTNLQGLSSSFKRLPVFLIALFCLNLLAVLIFSGSDFYESFYGTFGRSTGFLNYLCLAILLFAGTQIQTALGFERISFFLFISGSVSLFYGILQVFDLEFLSWSNPYGPVIGFLGNPNFQSSFLAFFGILLVARLLGESSFNKRSITYLVVSIFNVFVIYRTNSQQGLLVLAIGVFFLVFIWIKHTKLKRAFIPLGVIGGSGLILGILGVLNIGPLAKWLFGPTVSYRGDYWEAGWRMTLDHPLLGVGLDNYGEWYRRSRSIEATLRRGPDITSNAAHNVFLDISSNGGFPLLIIYVLLMLFVSFAAINLIKRSLSTRFDSSIVGLITVWLAYQIQSVISLNQIGLSVWGWAISGLIIGLYIHNQPIKDEKVHQLHQKDKKDQKKKAVSVHPRTVLGIFVGALIGMLVSIPSLASSMNYLSTLKSGNLENIQSATNSWPPNLAHQLQTAASFRDASFNEQSLQVTRSLLARYPDSYRGWEILASLPNVDEREVLKAKAQMKRLDPLNPNLK